MINLIFQKVTIVIDDTEEELLEEEIVEDVPKDKDVQLEEVSEEEPIGLNTN